VNTSQANIDIQLSREEIELLVLALFAFKGALDNDEQTEQVVRARQQTLNLILRLERMLQNGP
jgi:hypothetical protein